MFTMKRLTLLLVLMMAPGLGGESVVFSNQAAAAGAAEERVGARPAYEYRAERWINAPDVRNPNSDNQLLPTGPTHEVEAKRLKLIFLLMMSLGQYRTPAN